MIRYEVRTREDGELGRRPYCCCLVGEISAYCCINPILRVRFRVGLGDESKRGEQRRGVGGYLICGELGGGHLTGGKIGSPRRRARGGRGVASGEHGWSREVEDDEPVHWQEEVSPAAEKPVAMAAAWRWRRSGRERREVVLSARGAGPNPRK